MKLIISTERMFMCIILISALAALSISQKRNDDVTKNFYDLINADDAKGIEEWIKKYYFIITNELQMDALYWAAKNGHEKILKLLIDKGTDVNLKYLLHVATSYGKENIVQILLQNGATVNEVDEKRKTALHLAVEYDRIEIAKILIDNCASLNPKDETMRRTPLHFAAMQFGIEFHDSDNIAELLIKNGANITIRGKYGETASDLAKAYGNQKIVNLLKEDNIDTYRDKRNCFPLHEATSNGNLEEIRKLITSNVDKIDEEDNDGNNALQSAILKDNEEISTFLVMNGINVNHKNSDLKSALHLVCEQGNLNITRLLIYYNADLNAQDYQDRTALVRCIKNGTTDLAELLIISGANVNIVDNAGCSALHFAALKGDVKIAEILISHGADMNQKDFHGNTALQTAYFNGNSEVIKFLKGYQETNN